MVPSIWGRSVGTESSYSLLACAFRAFSTTGHLRRSILELSSSARSAAANPSPLVSAASFLLTTAFLTFGSTCASTRAKALRKARFQKWSAKP